MKKEPKPQRNWRELLPEIQSPATNRALSALLKIINIDTKEAAAALGMEAGLLADYVSGKRELPLAEYREICAAFRVESPGEGLRNLAAYLSGEEPLRERISGGQTEQRGTRGRRRGPATTSGTPDHLSSFSG